MGCSFEFDPGNNILRYCWDGKLTDKTLLEGDAAARRLLAGRPPCRGILDFSRIVTIDASSETVRRLAFQPPAYGFGQAVVLVAPKDVAYSLSRMFVMLGETKRPSMHVVRTMEEAYRRLGIDSPQFNPISDP